ncbi:MAG TPA: hypothetical protein VFB06_21870 [Streptosporangiaceae bacterium]|nr:hypothetical protein [Streptosporangiaceae bacterium]
MTESDVNGLVFLAEMYGVQSDQLAGVLGTRPGRARSVAARWRSHGLTEQARLGPGPPWIWVTRRGLTACGLRYSESPPALSRLAHIRAVTSVRLALEGTEGYRSARAYWRGERRLRAGCQVGARYHLPDGEVHWPDDADVAWAGECWAIEAELTRKTVVRTAAIMHELLSRTGDYGCAAGDIVRPGRPPRHVRALYVCSPGALPTVARARASLGPDANRIEIRELPVSAALADPAEPVALVATPRRAPPAQRPASTGTTSSSSPTTTSSPTASSPDAAETGDR